MKKTITLGSIILLVVLLIVQTTGNDAHSNNSGAPAGRTGSPADGATCNGSNCHAGLTTPSATQIISSNVPSTGYLAGQTYTITATCAQTGINKYGFQISPQSLNGTLLGQLVVTNATTTKIVGGKYITHTASGTAGMGTKTWTFNWVAPAAGTGDVTFYGAFNFANSSSTASGDIIRSNTLIISEDSTTSGIAPVDGDQLSTILYPNPILNDATLRVSLTAQENVTVKILSLNGQLLAEPMDFLGLPGTNDFEIQIPSNLISGTYKLMVTAGEATSLKTFFKN
jgi:Secretion system C-terminal sorting domain